MRSFQESLRRILTWSVWTWSVSTTLSTTCTHGPGGTWSVGVPKGDHLPRPRPLIPVRGRSTTWIVTLEGKDEPDNPASNKLKRALKCLLRAFGLKCLDYREVGGESPLPIKTPGNRTAENSTTDR